MRRNPKRVQLSFQSPFNNRKVLNMPPGRFRDGSLQCRSDRSRCGSNGIRRLRHGAGARFQERPSEDTWQSDGMNRGPQYSWTALSSRDAYGFLTVRVKPSPNLQQENGRRVAPVSLHPLARCPETQCGIRTGSFRLLNRGSSICGGVCPIRSGANLSKNRCGVT